MKHKTTRERTLETLLEDLKLIRRCLFASHIASGAKAPQITSSQWIILAFLKHTAASTVGDIAKHIHTSQSAATQMVNALVKGGYVTKKTDPRDRRAVMLSLSKKANAHMERMNRNMMRGFLKAFEALNEREFQEYCRLNKKIVRKFTSI
jgi:DNA-binding MarR family transcriptional regulator